MDIMFFLIELGCMIFLFFVAGLTVSYASNNWRILYAAPTFLAVIMVVFYGFDINHVGFYIAAILQILCLFMNLDQKRQKKVMACISAIILVVNYIYITISPAYQKIPFLSDFEKAYSTMKEHYILTEEKGIDFDELYAKYKPQFKEIDKSQNHVENYKTWQRFIGEFYDGHVSYQMKDDNLFCDSIMRSFGNDYGLSLARLSTGEYAAINVEGYNNSYSVLDTEKDLYGFNKIKGNYEPENLEEIRLSLKNAGIENGTIITKWNGIPIDELLEKVDYYIEQYPVKENEEFYIPIYAAGIGKEMSYGITFVPGDECKNESGEIVNDNPTVDITFIGKDGEEKVVSAPSLGVYAPRMMSTMDKIDNGVNITNLTWQKVNEDSYMIRISEMAYDSDTYEGADYTEMTDKLREEVISLKEAGVKNIIFDLRKNGGGSPFFVEAIAQLFAPKGEHITYYNAVINEDNATFERGVDGKYQMGVPSSYVGEDLWHDGQIILLVNAMCVSAGDDMTYIMGSLPNVRVMGFTRSNSSCQAVTSVHGLESGLVSFSAVPTLLPDGEIAIDTYTDHAGRTPFDHKIPFDKDAISAIFDNGEDYLLSYVAEEF